MEPDFNNKQNIDKIITSIKKMYDNCDEKILNEIIADGLKEIQEKADLKNEYFDIKKYLISYISNTISTKVNAFIDDNIKIEKKYLGCLNELNKLSNLFSMMGYYPNMDDLLMIANNKTIGANIKVLLMEKHDFDGYSLICSLVECYAILNNLELDNSEEMLSIEMEEFEINSDSKNCGSFGAYLREIYKFPLLTSDEEKKLFYQLRSGNMKAREILAERNLRLVVSVAKKFLWSKIPLEDLIQNGMPGLMDAIDRFNVDKGVRFATYATWWIRQNISRSIYDLGNTIRIPIYLQERLNRYLREKDNYFKNYGKNPTDKEMASILNITVEQVKELLLLNGETISSNTILSDDGDLELQDFLHDDTDVPNDVLLKDILPNEIKKLLYNNLSEKEIMVLVMRFGLFGSEPNTLAEIGDKLKMSRERIRQIEIKALSKLSKSDGFDSFSVFADKPSEFLEYTAHVKECKEARENLGVSRKKDNLNNIKKSSRKVNTNSSNITSQKVNTNKVTKKRYMMLFTKFAEYDQSQIIEAINLLDLDNIAYLKKFYGEKFNEKCCISALTEDECIKLFGEIFPAIREKLNYLNIASHDGKMVPKKFMDYFPTFDKQDVLLVLSNNLDSSEKKILAMRFGTDLDKVYLINNTSDLDNLSSIIRKITSLLPKVGKVRTKKLN